MTILKTLYYYYYLFYTKVLPDDEPHATVTFTLGFSLSLLINGILNLSLSHLCKYALSKYQMVLICCLTIGLLYFTLYKIKEKIIKNKPAFFNNHRLSIILTVFFFLSTSSFLIWDPIITRLILQK